MQHGSVMIVRRCMAPKDERINATNKQRTWNKHKEKESDIWDITKHLPQIFITIYQINVMYIRVNSIQLGSVKSTYSAK